MLSYLAVSGLWTTVIPPFPLMAFSPSVPSLPVPERTTPMAFSRLVFGQASRRNGRSASDVRVVTADFACRSTPPSRRERSVRRNHVDVVRLDRCLVLDLPHRHGGGLCQQFRHQALPIGIEMLDEDERHAAVRGYVRKELLKRLQPSRRSTHPNYRACVLTFVLRKTLKFSSIQGWFDTRFVGHWISMQLGGPVHWLCRLTSKSPRRAVSLACPRSGASSPDKPDAGGHNIPSIPPLRWRD